MQAGARHWPPRKQQKFRHEKADLRVGFFLSFDPSCQRLTPFQERKGKSMQSRVKRTQKDYTLAFKLGVVEQVEKGELTYKQAQAKYGIQGRSTVLAWMRKHGRRGWGHAASLKAMPIDKTPTQATPEQQIKALEVQLKQAQEKAQLFEAVIDVLRKDYGVRIVKKPLGKSSTKRSSKGCA
jgi:transposase